MSQKALQPVFFAHRGACAHAPENTLASFRTALEHGADAIELDAKLSADGQVVVIHDQSVDRTTGAHGLVGQLKLSELKALEAGSFFGEQFRGEPIPTLSEVFELVGKRMLINVEVTNYASPLDDLPNQVVAEVKRHGLEDNVLFSSFHPLNLIRIHNHMPKAPAAILCGEGKSWQAMRTWLGRLVSPHLIHPYFSDVTPEFMREQQRLNRQVNVWTVNQPEEMRRLYALGVHGIITDDPRLARATWESL
ncbi:MAG: glycerophosphodiester phosphodiesterase family protein [Anaerolineaceae bacterium]|nr:glycerophosphodiester phosphodiesterase family protein [Anaerolineaceae bacterium]